MRKRSDFNRMLRYLPVFMLIAVLNQGCSMQKFALRSTVDIFDTASLAVEEETDIEIARPAIFSNTKVLEGFLKGDPQNIKLNILVIKSLFTLSMAYIEDEYEEFRFKDPNGKAKTERIRASKLYQRAYRYGFTRIKMECQSMLDLEDGSTDDFKKCIDSLGSDYTELVFWTGFAWSKYVFLNLDDPKQIGQLQKLLYMMDSVGKKDETIYFGSLYTFYGSYYGSRSKMLGGDPQKSLEYFKRAIEYNKKTNLIAHLFKAQFYAVQTMDEQLFKDELSYVIDYSGEYNPRLGFLNAVAKKKAKRLLGQIQDIF